MYFIIFEILQYFTPKKLGIRFSGTRSRLQNNYTDYSLPYLASHLRRSLCILKIKALVTALQFIRSNRLSGPATTGLRSSQRKNIS
jgi:hypothetical protein